MKTLLANLRVSVQRIAAAELTPQPHRQQQQRHTLIVFLLVCLLIPATGKQRNAASPYPARTSASQLR